VREASSEVGRSRRGVEIHDRLVEHRPDLHPRLVLEKPFELSAPADRVEAVRGPGEG
jgi:hypothetical protein